MSIWSRSRRNRERLFLTLFQQCRRMRLSGDQRQNLRLIDRRVGLALAVFVQRFLRFPALVEQKSGVVVVRLIHLEAKTAWLFPRQTARSAKQVADGGYVRPFLHG